MFSLNHNQTTRHFFRSVPPPINYDFLPSFSTTKQLQRPPYPARPPIVTSSNRKEGEARLVAGGKNCSSRIPESTHRTNKHPHTHKHRLSKAREEGFRNGVRAPTRPYLWPATTLTSRERRGE
eukprot:GHVS01001646.1.p1 GENE.GHVS01001646.1~~GHVS01001646.1.p1  ORF type:complete len:123 (+),score=18.00 GHVS01001646.1:156-524(+)